MSGRRVMTRLMVSSARSSASLKPLEIKTLTSPARIVSYFWAPTSRSLSPNQVKRVSNCSWVIVTVLSTLIYYTFGSSDERYVCRWTAFWTGQQIRSPDVSGLDCSSGPREARRFPASQIRYRATRTIPPNVSACKKSPRIPFFNRSRIAREPDYRVVVSPETHSHSVKEYGNDPRSPNDSTRNLAA